MFLNDDHLLHQTREVDLARVVLVLFVGEPVPRGNEVRGDYTDLHVEDVARLDQLVTRDLLRDVAEQIMDEELLAVLPAMVRRSADAVARRERIHAREERRRRELQQHLFLQGARPEISDGAAVGLRSRGR